MTWQLLAIPEPAAGHVTMVSHPDEVAQLIKTAAEACAADAA